MARIKTFVPNAEDNLHCLQSCFAMIHNTVFDGSSISVKEAEVFTNFNEGLPTWPFKAMLSFANKGLQVVNTENFPISLFLENPEKAIKQQFSDDKIVKSIISISNLPNEVDLIKKSIATGKVKFDQRIPVLNDIKKYLDKGWFIICNINSYALAGRADEYAGHFVIVEDINEDFVVVQNPGLPPISNQKVLISDFLHAWNYPDENVANFIAVSDRAQ